MMLTVERGGGAGPGPSNGGMSRPLVMACVLVILFLTLQVGVYKRICGLCVNVKRERQRERERERELRMYVWNVGGRVCKCKCVCVCMFWRGRRACEHLILMCMRALLCMYMCASRMPPHGDYRRIGMLHITEGTRRKQ